MPKQSNLTFWVRVFGWKVGDRCQKQGATRMLHGEIRYFTNVSRFDEKGETKIPSAIVCWDSKSYIARVQTIPLDQLEAETDDK